MDRDAFLSRVGQKAMTSVLPTVEPVPEALPVLEEEEDLVSLFRDRAQMIDAVVHGPISPHGAPKAVSGIAAGHGCELFLAWDELPAPGVISTLSAGGLQRVDHELPESGRTEHQAGYVTVDLGVTGASAGLADSGSLVLMAGEGKPRMASLIPEVHVALLDVNSLHRTLSHWAHDFPEMATETANLVMISGPSRTGDIEQALNLGVHGPRHLHIVMLK